MNEISLTCEDCYATIRFEEKSYDDNKAMYGPAQFCPFCGKRSLT